MINANELQTQYDVACHQLDRAQRNFNHTIRKCIRELEKQEGIFVNYSRRTHQWHVKVETPTSSIEGWVKTIQEATKFIESEINGDESE